jgi:hypothetical protein
MLRFVLVLCGACSQHALLAVLIAWPRENWPKSQVLELSLLLTRHWWKMLGAGQLQPTGPNP